VVFLDAITNAGIQSCHPGRRYQFRSTGAHVRPDPTPSTMSDPKRSVHSAWRRWGVRPEGSCFSLTGWIIRGMQWSMSLGIILVYIIRTPNMRSVIYNPTVTCPSSNTATLSIRWGKYGAVPTSIRPTRKLLGWLTVADRDGVWSF